MPKAAIACIVLLVATIALSFVSPWVKQKLTWRAVIMEDVGGTIEFDPVRGFRIAQEEARLTQYTWGVREYIGAWRGNNMGFQDLRDFHPERPDSETYRLAVFGDSMTAAPYLEKSWADVVEELARAEGIKLELLSFAQDGTGLSNWWNLVVNEIEVHDYQLDGVLFACGGDTLRRAFSIMSEHDGHIWFGEVPFPEWREWNPDAWPKTLEEAQPYLRPIGMVYEPAEFERALDGDYGARLRPPLASVPNTLRSLVLPMYDRYFGDTEAYKTGQSRMIADLAQWADANEMDRIVVQLALREEIKQGAQPIIYADIQDFADTLQTDPISGVRAFEGQSSVEILERYWLPHDGHWAQAGSDKFATFIFDELKRLLPLSDDAE